MSEFGPEIAAPGEAGARAPEELSEEAKQRFAASAAAMKALQREEKKSKKRDSRVARTIIQFLNDDRYAHLFVLISRLVGRDCPSIFILAILSLIDDECEHVVKEFLQETGAPEAKQESSGSMQIMKGGALEAAANQKLLQWIMRMQTVLALDPRSILLRLMVDARNIDGTVLQLTTFVLQEFFRSDLGGRRDVPFEKLHLLSANILQTVFEPFMGDSEKHLLGRTKAEPEEGEDV